MSNPAIVNRALALYNAPPYPYNTPEDINQVNIGYGKKRGKGRKIIKGKGKSCNGKCNRCGKGRIHIRRRK